MLPSLGFQEIILLGVLALVVIGPKDLPLMLRKLGRWTARLRGMAQEFRTGFDELARQAELDELKREVEALRQTTNLNSLANDITKALPTLEDYAGVSKPTTDTRSNRPALTSDDALSSEAASESVEFEVEGLLGDELEPARAAQQGRDQASPQSNPTTAPTPVRSAP
ncbi:MAG: Sec-independent protein translocase protein TatB [Hyphomonadaceae bacterium]|nr:Sec-independent protein translocase protein TatB [Hyphomonadaceae bacterium]